MIRLGESAGRQLGSGARCHLARVAHELGETANLAMLDGEMAVADDYADFLTLPAYERMA